MPVCVNAEPLGRRWFGVLLYMMALGLCGVVPAVTYASGFKVSSVQARLTGPALQLSGNVELGLTPEVEEAIGTGIPIKLVFDVRLYRARPFLWDTKMASWKFSRELRYHALAGQYLINASADAPVARESFATLGDALAQLGTLDGLTFVATTPLPRDADYEVRVRASLDVEALPALLRPVAYTSRAWDLNSGWTTWSVQR
ncbi:MAG: DUF4390 domain-containing protein [Sulfurifustis sp.]